jgi:hypothetical protein
MAPDHLRLQGRDSDSGGRTLERWPRTLPAAPAPGLTEKRRPPAWTDGRDWHTKELTDLDK